jgi:hypothetical protein
MTVNGMFSLLEAAAHFRTFGANVEIAKQATLAEIAILIRDEAKSAIGTYRYHWSELADATKEDRAKKGFSEDEPGLRTGEMRDSINNLGVILRETLQKTAPQMAEAMQWSLPFSFIELLRTRMKSN